MPICSKRKNMFKVTVSGISEATLWEPTHTKIIGLLEPSKTVHAVKTTKPYCLERFHDIERPLGRYVHPTIDNVERILDFSKDFTEDDKILIHCQAGISRSTATCILVLVQHGMSIKEAFDHTLSIRKIMNPNSLLLEYGDTLLKCDGAIVKHYSKWVVEEKVKYTRFAGM
jgi:predicted protein tyrosine phosphatase